MSEKSEDLGRAVRGLIRRADRAALATGLGHEGWPYASLTLLACDHDSSPLLLLSELAAHTSNIRRDPRVSLLIDETRGLEDPLMGTRVTVLGRAERTEETRHRRRFLARHRAAAAYAGFSDFSFYKVAVSRAHLISGFGRVLWIEAGDFLHDPAEAAALVEAETEIVEHMNADHAEAVALYAGVLLGRGGEGWRLTGVDAEGADLRRGADTARLDFAHSVTTPEEARRELVRLAEAARGRG